MSEHRLVDGTLYNEGGGKGIIGRCTCGWSTGYRCSSMTASAAIRDHIEEAGAKERKAENS